MSLATSGVGGAGAGAGGLSMATMAHGGPNALQTHQQASAGGSGGAGPPPGTTAAPVSAAALGADQLDKNQNLNWKQIKKVESMPLVGVDLYGDKADVSYYPSVENDKGKGFQSHEDWIKVKNVGSGSCLVLKRGDEASYKALRRLLTKSKGYENVFEVACTPADKKKDVGAGSNGSSDVPIPSPQLLLGARQIKQLHKQIASKYVVGNSSSHIIDEDKSKGGEALTIENGNLDGSTVQQNNDFDRVTFNLKLLASKKALTILPEEAVGILVAKAKHDVHKTIKNGKDDEEEEVDYLEYPSAFAIPAWACYDHTIDSLMDACQGSNPVLYQRSIAALAGSFVPRNVIHDNKQKLENTPLYNIIVKKLAEHKKKTQIAQQQKKELPNQSYSPMVIMAGMTNDGLELTAIEVKNPNETYFKSDCHTPYGEFKVISSVAFNHTKPLSLVPNSFTLLTDNIDEMCPELEEDGGVAAIVTYGTIEKQLALRNEITKTLKGIDDDEVWNEKILFLSTREEVVSVGTSVMAAVSHVRIAKPSIDVKNVSPVAVGLSYNFHGGSTDSKWTEPKMIFDYDRRVPAGPTKIDFSAAECVALRKDPSLLNDSERLLTESEKWSSGKSNSLREEAALDLRVRVVQRVERDGAWRQVDNVMTPLTKEKDTEDENSDESQKYAIESSTLELSLDSIGFLSAKLISDG